MNLPWFSICFVLGWLMLASTSAAESRRMKAGDVWGVSEDVVLSGADVVEIRGTADKPCRIDANAQHIRTAPDWTGNINIQHCEFRGLGTADKPALDLRAASKGEQIVIEHSQFHACGALHISNGNDSATRFCYNHLRDSSLVPVTNLPSQSPPGFVAKGRSTASKFFQGNHVGKSVVLFENTNRWTIGGDRTQDSNLLIGLRASLTLQRSDDMLVRGNYIHTDIASFRWSQVHTLSVGSPCERLVVEHNVLRHGQWVVRGLAGEFRYNLVLDADGHNFIVGPTAGTHIHHNIFARYCTVDPNLNSSIAVIYKGDDIQIFNNTFDGGGKQIARPWHVPAIEVGANGFLASLRNNAFCFHPTNFASGTATVRPGFSERITSPAPARLGYADYNLFYNPDAKVRQNYALAVANATERVDSGFGRHDVPAVGEKNAQVEPHFRGPIPNQFPFSDADIATRKVTVADILKHYRTVYSPADDSPLLGAGDPRDGEKSYIGAIGAGPESPRDEFGKPWEASG